MSDSIEKIVAEMREEIAQSSYVVEISVEAMKKWANRLASLRQVPDGYVLVRHEEHDALLAQTSSANPAPPTSSPTDE